MFDLYPCAVARNHKESHMINQSMILSTAKNKFFSKNYKLFFAIVLSGLILAGCSSRGTNAPIADYTNGTTQTQAAQGTYVVKPGDTMYKIAKQHNIDVARLEQLNNITDPTQLSVGQVLRLDGATPAPAASTVVTKPVTSPDKIETAARASDASLISWGWPTKGKVIQSFNSNTKGIDIEGNVGDPVIAAAAGKVMYAGNGVRGLGNLILLGHSNGFITAYAHNQELLVKTGATVKKGEKIATVGQSDTTSPRLHFEIRRKGTPVNPLSYLPAQ